MLGTQCPQRDYRPRAEEAWWWAQLLVLYKLIWLHGAFELVENSGPAVWRSRAGVFVVYWNAQGNAKLGYDISVM